MNDYLSTLPALSGLIRWGPVEARFAPGPAPDERMISNVSFIPTVGEGYVVMRLEDGRWELIGGTLEPGESYPAALERELMEEIGGKLSTCRWFGHFKCESKAERPYRPHIPHPRFVRQVGFGEVRLVGKPLNPPDGEQVAVVEVVGIGEAVRRFEAIGRGDIAELYKLAHHLRAGGGV